MRMLGVSAMFATVALYMCLTMTMASAKCWTGSALKLPPFCNNSYRVGDDHKHNCVNLADNLFKEGDGSMGMHMESCSSNGNVCSSDASKGCEDCVTAARNGSPCKATCSQITKRPKGAGVPYGTFSWELKPLKKVGGTGKPSEDPPMGWAHYFGVRSYFKNAGACKAINGKFTTFTHEKDTPVFVSFTIQSPQAGQQCNDPNDGVLEVELGMAQLGFDPYTDNKYHTYGFDWQSTKIKFIVDGIVEKTWDGPLGLPWNWEFDAEGDPMWYETYTLVRLGDKTTSLSYPNTLRGHAKLKQFCDPTPTTDDDDVINPQLDCGKIPV